MDSTSSDSQPSIQCHAVAIPFPGRGHINTMMNFCLKLASKQPNLLITFIVTEEWFGFLSSETEVPPNISFGTIPNAIPSELVRAADHSGFVEATLTKMEEPVEWLIHRLDPRPVVIIYDYFLLWVPELGNKKSIPVASLCPISAKVFSMQMHHHLLVQNGDLPVYNMSGFVQATLTKMEEPVERLIGQLDLRPRLIIYDMFLMWIPGVGNRMNIPVASFWPMSATVFSMYQHRHLLVHNGHFPVTNLSEQGEDEVDYIPGVPTTRILDLPSLFYGRGQGILDNVFEAFSLATKAHFLLLTSVYELEKQVIDALRAEFCMPVYAIGPAIPYFQIKQNCSPANNDQDFPHYIKWLDSQPNDSVLYISQGSFLSVSSDQMDEIVAGVLDSGVSYLWVTRNMEASGIDSAKGLAVPWCDQLRVLCHPSVGGFWSHCGWNSTKEGVFAGVPMLTLPILSDQFTNSKVIVEDWKIGWRVKRRTLVETLVTRVEIARLVKGFMDLESDEGKEMRKRVKKLEQIAGQATAKGGSSENAINAFIGNVLPSDGH